MRAFLSVYDKTGVVDLAKGLADAGWELVSSGGTAAAIREAGIEVADTETVTGYPAILGHRVATLHPKIHGAILADPTDPEHQADPDTYDIEPFSLAVATLYPFGNPDAARDAGAVLGRSDRSALPPLPLTLDNPADWDGRYQIRAREAGLTAAPLGRNASALPAAARNRLSGLPGRARATLPVLMRGADIAAAPLLDYNAGLAGLDYLAPARLAHMRLGAKTAGPGGEGRSGAPHSDSEIRGERRSLKPGLGP